MNTGLASSKYYKAQKANSFSSNYNLLDKLTLTVTLKFSVRNIMYFISFYTIKFIYLYVIFII